MACSTPRGAGGRTVQSRYTQSDLGRAVPQQCGPAAFNVNWLNHTLKTTYRRRRLFIAGPPLCPLYNCLVSTSCRANFTDVELLPPMQRRDPCCYVFWYHEAAASSATNLFGLERITDSVTPRHGIAAPFCPSSCSSSQSLQYPQREIEALDSRRSHRKANATDQVHGCHDEEKTNHGIQNSPIADLHCL